MLYLVLALILAEYSLWYRRRKKIEGPWFLFKRCRRYVAR
jgi:hypothetical protein